MKNQYKYLSSEGENWGLSILNVGSTIIPPGQLYPNYYNHPSTHHFTWNKGRVLDEYQLVYIPSGRGIFESSSANNITIEEGAVFFLLPGERHRYKPDNEVGWQELWVGFSGDMMNTVIKDGFFKKEFPIFYPNDQYKTLNLFTEIINGTQNYREENHPLLSGVLIHLLGHLKSEFNLKKTTTDLSNIELLVLQAQEIFKAKVLENISPEVVANELNLSYAKFRRVFKDFSGISPGQYLLGLKIQKAKHLLLNSTKSIKDISYDLNFDSPNNFSTIFKLKTGLAPIAFREKKQFDNKI